MKKTDVHILKRGLKRVALALMTTASFVIGALGFIATAVTPGYLAVLLFLVSVFVSAIAFCLLYGHGLNHKINAESKGENNE